MVRNGQYLQLHRASQFCVYTNRWSSRHISWPQQSEPFPPTPNAKTLLLEQGDRVRVTLKDTPDGLLSVVEDLTTGASGFMVASAANGFETVNSSGQAIPFDFRPLYNT